MAKVTGFAKAFAGCRRIVKWTSGYVCQTRLSSKQCKTRFSSKWFISISFSC
jgi:hypothetical protein